MLSICMIQNWFARAVLQIHKLECTRILDNVGKIWIFDFEQLLLYVVRAQADHELILLAAFKLVAKATIHRGMP